MAECKPEKKTFELSILSIYEMCTRNAIEGPGCDLVRHAISYYWENSIVVFAAGLWNQLPLWLLGDWCFVPEAML